MSDTVTRPRPADVTDDLVFDGEFLRRLERLELLAKALPRNTTRGEHTTRQRGAGLEFSDFRSYHPGDDVRYIDWNIYSRLDRLVVKVRTSEEDVTLHIIIDVSASMGFGTPSKFNYARRLAAALAYIALCNLERVSISVFSNGLQAYLAPVKAKRSVTTVLDFLRGLACDGSTHFRDALLQFTARNSRRQVVVVISDFLSEQTRIDDIAYGLDSLRFVGHQVAALQVLDDEDVSPTLHGVLRLIDVEHGGEIKVTVDDALKTSYEKRVHRYLDAIDRHCRRTRIDYIRLSTSTALEQAVLGHMREGRVLR